MGGLTGNLDDLPIPSPIRVETALSRYPVHRLSKRGDISIDIREKTQDGEVSVRWEVNHNSKYGQPGPLAYKLDTLIINRRIEEAIRPISKTIRLGGLKEISRELGLAETGGNTNQIKKSLYQNALSGITAKIRFKANDGREQELEAVFTRYSVILTGEKLPDGRKADAVYIVLNDVYMQVINGAMTRPLDYDYIKELSPAPQRFYELLSFKMYAAILNDRDRAKLLYSEFCRYAPLTRHVRWELVRKQLAKIHAPHKKSGYIGRIDCQAITDGEGKPDWVLNYQPGPKARAEYRAFAKRGGPTVLEIEPVDGTPTALPLFGQQPDPSPLAAELIERGVSPGMACDLVEQCDAGLIRGQMDILDWKLEHQPTKVDEPGGWLVKGIRRGGYAPPKGYKPKAEREKQARQAEANHRQREVQARAAREKDRREQAETERIDAYWARLGPGEQAALQAEADGHAEAQPVPAAGPLRSWGQTINRREHIRKLLEAEGELFPSE